MTAVSKSIRNAYFEDGVVCVRRVLPSADLQAVTAVARQLLDEEVLPYESTLGRTTRFGDQSDPGDPGRSISGVYLSEEHRAIFQLTRDPRVAGLARDLMGADSVRFFYDQLFIRESGTKTRTAWHNDLPFWPFQGEDLISCWIALTPVTTESSGLEYVAGSHRWGIQYRATVPWLADDTMELAPDFSLPEHRLGQRILSWEMEPGDVLCHHPCVVHGAGGNELSTRRIALSIRYLGDDVRWTPREKATKLSHEPRVPSGTYPADDVAFPVVF